THNNSHIAVVYTSSILNKPEEDKAAFFKYYNGLGFNITDIKPQIESGDSVTAGTETERAANLSHALTSRKYAHVIAARGGYGCTAILEPLHSMLPPVLPKKTIMGFSDVTFIGNYLALKYPSVTYVHCANAFDDAHFKSPERDRTAFV